MFIFNTGLSKSYYSYLVSKIYTNYHTESLSVTPSMSDSRLYTGAVRLDDSVGSSFELFSSGLREILRSTTQDTGDKFTQQSLQILSGTLREILRSLTQDTGDKFTQQSLQILSGSLEDKLVTHNQDTQDKTTTSFTILSGTLT